MGIGRKRTARAVAVGAGSHVAAIVCALTPNFRSRRTGSRRADSRLQIASKHFDRKQRPSSRIARRRNWRQYRRLLRSRARREAGISHGAIAPSGIPRPARRCRIIAKAIARRDVARRRKQSPVLHLGTRFSPKPGPEARRADSSRYLCTRAPRSLRLRRPAAQLRSAPRLSNVAYEAQSGSRGREQSDRHAADCWPARVDGGLVIVFTPRQIVRRSWR